MTNVPMIDIDKGVSIAPIEARLREVIWRARAAIVVRGIFCTIAAMVAGILLAMVIAAKWLPVEPIQYYALTLLWVVAGIIVAFLTLVRPLARSFTLAGIARVVEQRHPELQERLSSTIELLESDDAPEIKGSQALLNALAHEAVSHVNIVKPRREINFKKALPPLYFLAGAVAILAVLFALYPAPVGRLLAKTVVPYLNLPNIYAEKLKVSPGDCVLAEGMSLEVRASIPTDDGKRGKKVSLARVRIIGFDGSKKIYKMTAGDEGVYTYATGPLWSKGPWGKSFSYRVRLDDAISKYYSVRIVPRPAITGIEVGYHYPEYVNRPDVPLMPSNGRLTGPAGTVATVQVKLNKPAEWAELRIGGKPIETSMPDAQTVRFTCKIDKNTGKTWRMVIVDEYGFKSDPIERSIILKPDNPPSVQITDPPADRKLRLRPTDRLPVSFQISDDFGITSADMLISIDGKRLKPVPLEVSVSPATPAGAGCFVSGSTVLDLAALDLSAARRVTFQIRARDNLPARLEGPQEGLSRPRTIELDVKAPLYALQVQLAMELRIREVLKKIYKELKSAKQISGPLHRTMPSMKTTIDALKEAGVVDKIKTLIGGAPVTQRYADEIGADGYARDAASGADKAKELIAAM